MPTVRTPLPHLTARGSGSPRWPHSGKSVKIVNIVKEQLVYGCVCVQALKHTHGACVQRANMTTKRLSECFLFVRSHNKTALRNQAVLLAHTHTHAHKVQILLTYPYPGRANSSIMEPMAPAHSAGCNHPTTHTQTHKHKQTHAHTNTHTHTHTWRDSAAGGPLPYYPSVACCVPIPLKHPAQLCPIVCVPNETINNPCPVAHDTPNSKPLGHVLHV